MPIWMWFVLFIYTLACLFLIFVILVQSGKGGGLSSLAGASSGLQEALGSTAGERTLNRLTYGAAGAFVLLAIILSLGSKSSQTSAPLLPESDTSAAAPITPGVGDTLPAAIMGTPAPTPSGEQPAAPAVSTEPAPAAEAPPATEAPAPAQ